MAAPTFVAAGTAPSSVTALAPSWPTHSAGDLGLLITEQSGGDTTHDLSGDGWAHVSGSPVVDVADATGSKLSVFWKIAASGSESGPSLPDNGDHIVGRIITVAGAHATTPIHITATGTKTTASTDYEYPSLTTTVADCAIVFVASRPNDSSGTTTFGAPSGGTLDTIGDLASSPEAGATSGDGGGFTIGWGTKLTAGATGTPGGTLSVSVTNAYIVIAIQPPGGGDTTAPVLTSPTGTETSDTTATIGATTDEGNGTIYGYVSTSATPPSGTDLKAGTGAVWAGSAAVSGTGAQTLNATGLTASTGYYGHLIHTDAAANDSNIVTSVQFTTDAAASPPGTPSTPAFDNITKTGYRVTWSAPGSGGTVSGYEYRINAGSWVDMATALEVTVTGRTPGDTDTVEVRAYGPGGAGTASTADITLPLYGFAFSTASGLVFGAIVGALTDIEVEAEAAEWTVFVHDDEDRSIVLTGSAVTIDAAGRLPDMTSATLDAGSYFVSFRRTSDGAWAAARLTTEDLS